MLSRTTPPSPTRTLFPYTTLFRSRNGKCDEQKNGHRARGYGRAIAADEPPESIADAMRAGEDGLPGEHALHIVREVAGDRKSTRLNSSHSQTSYAVFCLKKKKRRC